MQLFSKRLVAATAAQDTSRIGLSIALSYQIFWKVLSLVLLCRNDQYPQAALNPQLCRRPFAGRCPDRFYALGESRSIGFKDAKTMQGYITASIQVQTQPLTSAAIR